MVEAGDESAKALRTSGAGSLGRALLSLAQRDRTRALRRAATLSLDEQVAAVCDAPLEVRTAILGLLPAPERVIPRLPEAELCFLCKHVGVHDSAWLLAQASDEQIVACVDLDAWSGFVPDRARLDVWFASLAEAGNPTLLRAARSLDPELLALYLRGHIEVFLKTPGDDGWEPPDAAQTLDGQFHFVARSADISVLTRLLHVLFEGDYWLYFRMLQSVSAELQPDLEEWALRWRTGRLEDMGFPAWDNAMRIYGFLRPERLGDVPDDAHPLDVAQWHLPVWIEELPAASGPEHGVFRAAAALSEHERRAFFYAFVALANRVAVADRRDLGSSETLPETIEKAAVVSSRGLDHIVGENRLGATEVLRRVPLERLFRVGVNLAPEGVRPPFSENIEHHEQEPDAGASGQG